MGSLEKAEELVPVEAEGCCRAVVQKAHTRRTKDDNSVRYGEGLIHVVRNHYEGAPFSLV